MIRRKLKLVNNKLTLNRESIAKISLGLQAYALRSSQNIPMTPEQTTQVKNLEKSRSDLKKKGEEFRKIKDELMQEFKKKSIGKISARSQVYAGAKIQVGSASLKVEEMFTFCSFKEDPYQPAIKLGSYEK